MATLWARCSGLSSLHHVLSPPVRVGQGVACVCVCVCVCAGTFLARWAACQLGRMLGGLGCGAVVAWRGRAGLHFVLGVAGRALSSCILGSLQ
eukprot:347430-Chlamydomonas_euryale.AAC.1